LGAEAVSLTVEATYEDGTLKLAQPLPLKNHEKVWVTVEAVTSPLLQAHGIMGWRAEAEILERIALDAEFDPLEAP
jgi:predicted DNA-binding antitoxin AbrB/MazE fold protein